jgi:uncharacterized protein (DUF2147 family)
MAATARFGVASRFWQVHLSHVRFLHAIYVALVLLAAGAASAQDHDTPAGLWRAFDDHTAKPSALIRLVEADGIVSGRIEKFLDPNDKPEDVCDKCTDDRKGQRILGMQILRNLHRVGDHYEGGDILDPGNGKIYRCNVHVADGGARLEVRGFIGFSLLGRTQTWERVE